MDRITNILFLVTLQGTHQRKAGTHRSVQSGLSECALRLRSDRDYPGVIKQPICLRNCPSNRFRYKTSVFKRVYPSAGVSGLKSQNRVFGRGSFFFKHPPRPSASTLMRSVGILFSGGASRNLVTSVPDFDEVSNLETKTPKGV